RLVQGVLVVDDAFGVAHGGNIDTHPLRDRGRVDVDMDDLARILREVARVAHHTVVETRTDGKQHVAVLHGEVGFVRAVHAWHADKALVGGRESPERHERGGDGRTHHVDQTAQFFVGAGGNDAATHVDHGALGRQQHLHGLLDLALVPLGDRRVRAHLDFAATRRVLAGRYGDVLGDIDQDGPGAAGTRNVEGTAHGLGQILDVAHQEIVLHAGARDAHGVAFLEGVFANGRGGNLAAEDHHGN